MNTLITYAISITVAAAVAYPVLCVIRDSLATLAVAL